MNLLNEAKQWYDFKSGIEEALIKLVPQCPSTALEHSLLAGKTLEQIKSDIRKTKDNSDDLAIILYWSVFEQTIMNHLIFVVLKFKAVPSSEFEQSIIDYVVGKGEYVRIKDFLDLYKKNSVSETAVGDVKQVYEYRNWVVHGKRERKPLNLSPAVAYQRLSGFLNEAGL
jgi:hypothetical protein